jgi:hypothetical protein
MATLVPGSLVRVITPAHELDPNTYRFDGFDGQRALVTNVATGIQTGIHRSRVFPADDGKTEEQIMSDANKKAAAATKTSTKVKPASGDSTPKKAERTPFDFAAELATMGAGAEHWRKTNNFDHDQITSEAHVLITGDRSRFRSLNTYDGSLGKNGKMGQMYDLKDYAKKVKELQSRGYALVNSPVANVVSAPAAAAAV